VAPVVPGAAGTPAVSPTTGVVAPSVVAAAAAGSMPAARSCSSLSCTTEALAASMRSSETRLPQAVRTSAPAASNAAALLTRASRVRDLRGVLMRVFIAVLASSDSDGGCS